MGQEVDVRMTRRAFVTGAAGFIGAHLAARLLDSGWQVCGLDNMNTYYRADLKEHRLAGLVGRKGFTFLKADLVDEARVQAALVEFDPHVVVHLAAQAGVRYSIDNPRTYIDSNLSGFLTILEAARLLQTRPSSFEHLVYASSSSVYGKATEAPYSVTKERADTPVSLYAATKRANELMAYTYAHLFGVPATGLRFFTVYGPAGRPDMAYYKFADRAVRGESIEVYNMGDLRRDFTYVDDIVAGIRAVMAKPPVVADDAPHKVYNIGNSNPETLLDFISLLEASLQRHGLISGPVKRVMLPMQPGDVYETFADMSDMERDFGFRPRTSLADGLERFVEWYDEYHSDPSASTHLPTRSVPIGRPA